MPTIWNEHTERQLLMLIIHLAAPKLPDWGALSDLMGEEFTGSACRQHYQLMRKKVKTQYGDFGPGLANASTAQRGPMPQPRPAVPTTVYVTSSATQTSGKASASGSSAGKRKGKQIEDDMDDEEAEAPVEKRVKKEEDVKMEL